MHRLARDGAIVTPHLLATTARVCMSEVKKRLSCACREMLHRLVRSAPVGCGHFTYRVRRILRVLRAMQSRAKLHAARISRFLALALATQLLACFIFITRCSNSGQCSRAPIHQSCFCRLYLATLAKEKIRCSVTHPHVHAPLQPNSAACPVGGRCPVACLLFASQRHLLSLSLVLPSRRDVAPPRRAESEAWLSGVRRACPRRTDACPQSRRSFCGARSQLWLYRLRGRS